MRFYGWWNAWSVWCAVVWCQQYMSCARYHSPPFLSECSVRNSDHSGKELIMILLSNPQRFWSGDKTLKENKWNKNNFVIISEVSSIDPRNSFKVTTSKRQMCQIKNLYCWVIFMHILISFFSHKNIFSCTWLYYLK